MKLSWQTCIRIAITAAAIYLFMYYWEGISGFVGLLTAAAKALITGAIIAYLVNIFMSFLERHYFPAAKNAALNKSRRPICMVLAYMLLILLMLFIAELVIPELIECITVLLTKVPKALEQISQNSHVQEYLPIITEQISNIDWDNILKAFTNWVENNLANMATSVTGTVITLFSTVANFIISLIFSIYLLLAKDSLCSGTKRLLDVYIKPEIAAKIKYVTNTLNDCFHRFIVGQCTEALILGSLCALGMFIFRFPYFLPVGALVGFMALIPIVGAFVGAAVGVLMLLTVSVSKAFFFLIFIIVLQQLEGNLIYPKVVGSSIGLPPLWVLGAVTIGGGIGGIGGMLIAVPLTAAMYKLVDEDIRRRTPMPIK